MIIMSETTTTGVLYYLRLTESTPRVHPHTQIKLKLWLQKAKRHSSVIRFTAKLPFSLLKENNAPVHQPVFMQPLETRDKTGNWHQELQTSLHILCRLYNHGIRLSS